ncbi:MAG: hypothetical protein A2V67_13005 [Deltaproteobacteria bacterium RBG_13_61_14]|nr:MAG: hypothetical protein A2V67_13005 [Deltaproteobacteria bacterium RBG_13_61_14]
MNFDLFFRNATILDGSGREPYTADLAVSRDRIEAIGRLEKLSARRVVEAQGLMLAPGFVDMHGHSDYHLLARPQAESKLLQGVTLEVGGNCGYSAAPVRGWLAHERLNSHLRLFGIRADFQDMAEYLDRLEEARPAINYAPLVGFNTVRAAVMQMRETAAAAEELKVIQELIARALSEGAWGASAGLIYPPGCYATPEELAAALQPVGEAGGLFACHIRSEGRALVEAIEEVIAVARAAEAPLQVSHLKTSGQENWHKLDQVFARIESAQNSGQVIRADRYPYIASYTGLSSSVLPEWVFAGSQEAYLGRLRDPAARERMLREINADHPDPEFWDRVVIAQVFSSKNRGFEGRTVRESAREPGKTPLDFVCDLLLEETDGPTAICHTMSEDNLRRIYAKDWVMIGSDSAVRGPEGTMAEGKPHPRVYGTFPRVLAWAVREKGMLNLAQAVKKMAADQCEALGIPQRGKIEPGFFADLVLFDFERLKDLATYEDPHRYPAGIELVVVNGEIAAEKGRATEARAGRVLRKVASPRV